MFNLLTKIQTHFGCPPLIIREMKTIRIQLKLDGTNVVNLFTLFAYIPNGCLNDQAITA